jgi:hypothetical protein
MKHHFIASLYGKGILKSSYKSKMRNWKINIFHFTIIQDYFFIVLKDNTIYTIVQTKQKKSYLFI